MQAEATEVAVDIVAAETEAALIVETETETEVETDTNIRYAIILFKKRNVA